MITSSSDSPRGHICPWWFIRSFDNPLRRLIHKPVEILRDFVRPNDVCLDLGCGFGYFAIPMAELVGPAGWVTAADIQVEMLAGVRRRAEKAGVLPRIRLLQVDAGHQLDGAYDFVLAFWMVHEVADQDSLFRGVRSILKPGGRMIVAEPKGHVSRTEFERMVAIAEGVGLVKIADLPVSLSHAAVFGLFVP